VTSRSRLSVALSTLFVCALASSAHADRRDHRGRSSGARSSGRVIVRGPAVRDHRSARSYGYNTPYTRDHRSARSYRGYPYRGYGYRSYYRPYYRGGVYVGSYYSSCYYYGDCGPYYYGSTTYYAPGYRAYGEPAIATTARPSAPLPRFGIGAFLGGTAFEGGADGADIGLVGRFRLLPNLLLEGELAKSELEGGERVDRSGGAAVLFDIAPWSNLSVNLLAGIGAGSTRLAGDLSANHVYAEVGVGLDWRITPNLSLIADLRAGQRELEDDRPATTVFDESSVLYNRARVGMMVNF
jgi:hypothetical protein